MNRRILLLLGFVLVLFIAAAGGAWVYFLINSPSSNIPGGNGTPTASLTPIGTTPVAEKGCGITKTSTGYTFSWLHVSNGFIMDDRNCIVNLKGFNWSQIEFGNAVGGSVKTRISEERVAWYNQMFHMNVWRIPVNAYWWNTNVNVPLAGMPYRLWIRQIVRWAEKHGDYVILTKGPQFHAPPCGGSNATCPPQDYGGTTGDPTQMSSGLYIDAALTMWTSIAKLYANDPAVLYDSWNEMHGLDAQIWQQNENALINAIRAQNPRSLIFLGGPNFKGNINPLVRGEVPDFTQPNLVYDFHVYDGYKGTEGTYAGKNCDEPASDLWKNWPGKADEQVGFAQQHGKAASFTEWGGCNDLDGYNQAITSYARLHHLCLVYYDETNVVIEVNGTFALSSNGMKVQAAYATF